MNWFREMELAVSSVTRYRCLFCGASEQPKKQFRKLVQAMRQTSEVLRRYHTFESRALQLQPTVSCTCLLRLRFMRNAKCPETL